MKKIRLLFVTIFFCGLMVFSAFADEVIGYDREYVAPFVVEVTSDSSPFSEILTITPGDSPVYAVRTVFSWHADGQFNKGQSGCNGGKYVFFSSSPFDCESLNSSYSCSTPRLFSSVSLYRYFDMDLNPVGDPVNGAEVYACFCYLDDRWSSVGKYISGYYCYEGSAFSNVGILMLHYPDLLSIGLGSGGGSTSQEVRFDSSIPTPTNFRCYSKKGGWEGLSYNKGVPYYLGWSNPTATDYGILLDGTVIVNKGSGLIPVGTSYDVAFESSNQDAVYGAWKNEYYPDWDKAQAQHSELEGLAFPADFYPTSFTLQFYTVREGVIYVGNKAKCTLTVDSNGHLFGSTTEIINLDEDMNETVDSDNSFTSDPDGNSTSTGGNSEQTFQEWLESFMNIPNVLNQFFTSLKNMMSGLGELPSFMEAVVGWLPAEVLALIALGVMLVVVLRIFGR